MTAEDDLGERLEEHVVPLERTTPDASMEDLDPLIDVFEGKTVFGLGEATHGTKEFFEVKHRLVEFLVTELDVRLFGLEANFSETLAIDRYVVTGEGDPEDALAGVYFWTWNTEEMLALVEWLREYNEGRPLAEKVRFYGFDAKFAQGPARAIGDFFERVDPGYLDEIGDVLTTLTAGPPGGDPDARREWLVAAETLTETLANRFETHEDAYRSETTDREWRLVQRHHRVVEQAAEFAAARAFADAGNPNGVRDASMAENVAWMLDHESADRIALWAHNGHVRRGTFRGGDWETPPKTMGQHLSETFGDDYHALGFEFGRGSFQAHPDPKTTDSTGIQEFSLGPPLEGSVPAILGEIDHPVYYLDVESATDDEAVGDWLARERRLHNVGSVFYDETDRSYESVELAREFDGLVFVAETNRAVPVGGL